MEIFCKNNIKFEGTAVMMNVERHLTKLAKGGKGGWEQKNPFFVALGRRE